MSAPGWFPDPIGRFGQRYYDGAAWTDHVVGANGQTTQDALPATDTPLPPPSRQHLAPAGPPPAPGYGGAPGYGPGYGQQPAPGPGWSAPWSGAVRYGPGAGLAIGLLGLLVAAVDLLGIPWSDADDSSFLDLSSAVRDAGPDAVDDTLVYTYVAWGGFVLLALTALLLVLACVPLPRSSAGNTYARVLGVLVAGGAAVLHTYLVAPSYHLDGAKPSVVPLLAIAGFLLAGLGMVIGARRYPVRR